MTVYMYCVRVQYCSYLNLTLQHAVALDLDMNNTLCCCQSHGSVFKLFHDPAPRDLPVEDLEHVHGVEPVPQPRVEVPRPLEQAKVDRTVALLPGNIVAISW